ncbi:MAG: ROK family transcriptional regulator [Bacteroidales bacterium]|nr:ROK family transcriptional regulator [Candidatus Cryptobacteroides choladohippi]MCQ2179613.1 ROK family transcriptional regulator [Bacteroidales bacterium]
MPKTFLNDASAKNATTKREIIRLCIVNNTHSIADFSKALGLSVPTTTKFVGELIDEGFLQDEGKIGTTGGRRPNIYGLNPDAGYFVGVDVARRHVHLAVCNFKGEMVHFIQDIEFVLEASEESFKSICQVIKEEVTGIGISWDKVLGVGVSLSGRVNPEKGYSLSYFVSEDIPLTAAFTRELGVPVSIENDSRAMTYGEYMTLGPEADKDFIFVNLSWGLGMGLILDGNLYYGKSGFSGEIGHFPLLDNNIICRCGKVGCLETGASGSALHRMVIEKLREGKRSSLSKIYKENGDIELEDILQAIREEDVLAIDCIGEIGETLGRAIAGVINIFNPGLVVIGGRLIVGKDYLRLPIKTAVNRLSLSRVNSDTKIHLSTLGRRAASIGDCLLSRAKILGLM